MIYRIPADWIERRRRMARWAPVIALVVAIGILCLTLLPRVDWSKAEDRRIALFITLIVTTGFGLGGIVGRVSFRNTMQNWQSFELELTPNELVRRMAGQEVRIQRGSVTSIREFPNRGFVVTDNLGWRIFAPKMIANYSDFRERILSWSNKS